MSPTAPHTDAASPTSTTSITSRTSHTAHTWRTRLIAAPALAAALAGAGALAAGPASAAAAHPSLAPAVKIAQHYRGVPYVWGGTSTHGFDCSGYVQYVFRKLGVSLPRTAEAQWAASKHIRRSQLKPGDLVFWGYPGGVYHVGIYAGHNKVWNAPHTGTRVQLETIWGGEKQYGRVRGLKTPHKAADVAAAGSQGGELTAVHS